MENIRLIIFIEIVVIVILEIGIYQFIKWLYAYNAEKRLENYSIKRPIVYEYPWFEKQKNRLIKLIKYISKLLSLSSFLKKYSQRYNKYIDYKDKISIKPIDYITIKFLVGISICFLYLISSFIQNKFDSIFLLVVFILGFFIPDIYLMISKRKRNKKLEDNLLESVIIMNNAFKSGKNILEAIEIVKDELNGPLKDEYKKIYIDLTYGLDIDVVFNRFYERVKLEDIKYISSSLTLLNQTGGNVSKVFNSIENNFYDKKVLKEELDALTSSSRLMFKLLLFVPIVIIILLFTLNSEYFSPLFSSKSGIIIIILALILYVLYAFVINKVTKVKL